MASRFYKALTWALLGFIGSAAFFGAIGALVLEFASPFVDTGETRISSMVGVAFYGVAHWVLLGLLTLPILVMPALAWPWVSRAHPSVEQSGVAFALALGVLCATAVLVRAALLTYPVLLKHPTSLVDSHYAMEWLALWLGLTIPRVALPSLKLGAFTQ